MRDIEDFETNVTQNKFRTVKEATDDIAELKEQIAKKIRKIDGKEEVE